MKAIYKIKSDRYNHTHRFERIGGNYYSFHPEEDWMPIYVHGEEDKIWIDTEGGPNIYKGWENDEIIVTYISPNVSYFELKEKPKK